ANDDVLAPPGDPDEALGILHGEIAGADVAVVGEDVIERRIEIADAELRSVGLDLALASGVDRPSGGAGNGPAVGAVQFLLCIADPSAGEHRTLGEAVGAEGEGAELVAQ